jgi:hypothetical protein
MRLELEIAAKRTTLDDDEVHQVLVEAVSEALVMFWKLGLPVGIRGELRYSNGHPVGAFTLTLKS